MTEEENTIIRVGEDRVGLRGLKRAMEELAQCPGDKTDEEIADRLLETLGERNYIAECARDEYAQALAREFRKYVGQPVEESPSTGLNVVVLGPGCAQCDRLKQVVKQVLTEMGVPAAVDHITDIKEIGSYGVFSTPALMVNGKMVSKGSVPSAKKIKEWVSVATR